MALDHRMLVVAGGYTDFDLRVLAGEVGKRLTKEGAGN